MFLLSSKSDKAILSVSSRLYFYLGSMDKGAKIFGNSADSIFSSGWFGLIQVYTVIVNACLETLIDVQPLLWKQELSAP